MSKVGVIGNGISRAAAILAEQIAKVRAEETAKTYDPAHGSDVEQREKLIPLSHARVLKSASDIPELRESLMKRAALGQAPQPVRGAVIRMEDKTPMVFFDDGSLRHAHGKRLNKAQKKQMKRARQRARQQGVKTMEFR